MKVNTIFGDHDTAVVELKLSELAAVVKLARARLEYSYGKSNTEYEANDRAVWNLERLLFVAEHGNKFCTVIGCHEPAIYALESEYQYRLQYRFYCEEHKD
jgi:hypothetical protein